MAPAISPGDLLLGIGIGMLMLAFAVAMALRLHAQDRRLAAA